MLKYSFLVLEQNGWMFISLSLSFHFLILSLSFSYSLSLSFSYSLSLSLIFLFSLFLSHFLILSLSFSFSYSFSHFLILTLSFSCSPALWTHNSIQLCCSKSCQGCNLEQQNFAAVEFQVSFVECPQQETKIKPEFILERRINRINRTM